MNLLETRPRAIYKLTKFQGANLFTYVISYHLSNHTNWKAIIYSFGAVKID